MENILLVQDPLHSPSTWTLSASDTNGQWQDGWKQIASSSLTGRQSLGSVPYLDLGLANYDIAANFESTTYGAHTVRMKLVGHLSLAVAGEWPKVPPPCEPQREWTAWAYAFGTPLASGGLAFGWADSLSVPLCGGSPPVVSEVEFAFLLPVLTVTQQGNVWTGTGEMLFGGRTDALVEYEGPSATPDPFLYSFSNNKEWFYGGEMGDWGVTVLALSGSGTTGASLYRSGLPYGEWRDNTGNHLAHTYLSGLSDSATSCTIAAPTTNGTYQLSIKPPKHLRETVSAVVNGQGIQITTPVFVAGDIDNDNIVSTYDYGALSTYFGHSEEEDGWMWWAQDQDGFSPDSCDLDSDYAVTVYDYAILSENMDLEGDE